MLKPCPQRGQGKGRGEEDNQYLGRADVRWAMKGCMGRAGEGEAGKRNNVGVRLLSDWSDASTT